MMMMRMWRKRNFHFSLMGMQNGTAILEDSLAMTYKTIHTLTMCCINMLMGIYPKGLKMCVCTKTCTWIFIAPLSILPKLGRNQHVLQEVNG